MYPFPSIKEWIKFLLYPSLEQFVICIWWSKSITHPYFSAVLLYPIINTEMRKWLVFTVYVGTYHSLNKYHYAYMLVFVTSRSYFRCNRSLSSINENYNENYKRVFSMVPVVHYLSQYLTNLMHKICFTISFISCLYMFRAHVRIIRRSKSHYTASGIITRIGGRLVHETATYTCDDTRGCVMQFWPPDDEHVCSKHVEAWNKTRCETNFVHQVG